MANRYWVGGTANWDGTAGTKWATTDGGAGGAAEPTVSDDVFFTALSGNVVVTVGTGTRSCRSLNCTGFTGTMTFAASLNIGDGAGGALTFSNTMTVTFTGAFSLSFVSSSTNGGAGWPITMNGRTWTTGGLNFSNAAGKWTLQDAVSMTGTFTMTAGILDTNGQSITSGLIATATGSSVKTINLGATVWTTTSGTIALNGTNLTINPGTSTIISNPIGLVRLVLPATGLTLYNFIRTGTGTVDTLQVEGGNLICNGTFQVSGGSVVNRMMVQSDIIGVQRTITAAVLSALTDNVDFMDIAGAGAASWDLSARSVGDCQGNSGITFPVGTTQTYTQASGNVWTDPTKWTSRIPLPQDDVVILGTGTLSGAMPRLGKNVNFTSFTGTFTMQASRPGSIYGSLTLGAGMLGFNTTNQDFTLAGRGAHTITTNGITINGGSNSAAFVIAAPGGSYTLNGAFAYTGNSATNSFTVKAGTFDSANFPMNIRNFGSSGSITRSVIFGTSVVTINSVTTNPTTIWDLTTITNLTISVASATIILNNASTFLRTFIGGSQSYGTLIYTVADSPGILSFTGNNTFKTFDVASGRSLTLTAGTTNTITNLFNVNGQNYGYLYLPGVTGNAPSTPSSVALDIAGDIELMFDGSVDNVSLLPNLISRDTQAGSTRTLYLRIMTGNVGQLVWFDASGTVRAATGVVNLGFTNGVRFALKATLDVDNGAGGHLVSFYTASTSAGPWTLRETTTAGAFTTNIRTGQSVPLAIGVNNSSTLAAVVGMKVYRTWVKNGINGTSAFDADFTTKPFGADTFVESSPNAATVTINGTLAQVGDGRVLIDSITTATHTLRVPATTSIDRVKIAHSTLTANSAYAGANSVNGGSNSTNPGWIFADSAKGNFLSVI